MAESDPADTGTVESLRATAAPVLKGLGRSGIDAEPGTMLKSLLFLFIVGPTLGLAGGGVSLLL
jgi:hypothetical protein